MMRAAVACLVFVTASVCIGVATGAAFGTMNSAISLFAILVGLAIAIRVVRGMPREIKQPCGIVDIILFGIFAVVAVRAFCWLLYSKDDVLHVLSPNNLGDMALHLNFIRYLAKVSPLWPQNPILVGAVLTYPIGVDFFNALLLNLHLNLQVTLTVMGLIASALTAYSLWKWGGAFTLAAFLFGEGIIAVLALCGISTPEEQWKNPFLALFVTQRGWLYALPVSLLLLRSWRNRLEEKPALPRGIDLLFYGTLPLFNVHAFLFLSAILASIWIFNPAHRREFFLFVAMAFLPAGITAALVTNVFGQTGGIRWKLGWLAEDGGITFWLLNFGIALPLSIALCVRVLKNGNSIARAFVGGAAFLFTLCLFISFAPWPWDNTKLMLLAWLTIAPFLWTRLILPTPVFIRIILCILLFGSGAISLWKGLDGRHGYSLAPNKELDAIRQAIQALPIKERIACAPEYNHPLLILGRPVVAGYHGHLWSHGLDYKQVWEKLPILMNGSGDWKSTARSLGIHYLFWGPREIALYPASQRPWENCAKKIAQSEYGILWDLQPCLEETQGNPTQTQDSQEAPPQS